jgi:hypothetical protein
MWPTNKSIETLADPIDRSKCRPGGDRGAIRSGCRDRSPSQDNMDRTGTASGLASLLGVFRVAVGMIPTLAAASAAGMFLYSLGALATPESVAASGALRLAAKIPLGAIAGRLDHLAIDPRRQRLYVTELGNNSLGVVDLKSRSVLRTLDDFSEPQGVLYLPSADQVYVANGGNGGLTILSGGDLSIVKRIDLGADADNIRLDPATNQVVVGYGTGKLAFLDPASGAKAADIALPGHPESFQFDAAGSRVFVNVPEAHEIAAADRATAKIVAHWRQDDGGNFAMAIDATGQQVIAAFRSPPVLGFFDRDTGALKQRLSTCEDVDDLFVDAKRQQLYVICGAGEVDIFAARQGGYGPIGRIATAPGARTGLFVPELDRLFVAVPASAQEAAAIWVFAPAP